MDEITRERIIIDYIIEFLQSGFYISHCNKYMGSYYDGATSNNRYNIDKRNIKFVDGDAVITRYGETLYLEPIAVKIEIEGVEQVFKRYLVIDVNDWSIYYSKGEWWYNV